MDGAIIYIHDLVDRLIEMRRTQKGPKKGLSTGFHSIDDLMLMSPGYISIISGMPSSGKSEVLDAIAVNMAALHGWSWVYYSPENYPVEEHAKKIAEKIIGKALWEMSNTEIQDAVSWIDQHFTWLYPPDDRIKLIDILTYTAKIKETKRVDALVIDPWNEIDHSSQGGQRDDQYISKCLSMIRRFNRANGNLHTCVVAHPRTMQRGSDNKYPVPTLYDINGGAMWRNKADYGWVVHRHDTERHEATVYFQKIKFKWMGKIGYVTLDYDFKTGRFKDQMNPCFTLPGQENDLPI